MGLLSALLGWLALPAAAALVGRDAFAPGDPVIDFETGTTAVPGDIPGVHFDQFNENATFVFSTLSPFYDQFGQQALANLSGPPSAVFPDGYTNLTVGFDQPVQAVGAFIFDLGPFTDVAGVTMIAFDASHQVIDSVFVPVSNQSLDPLFVGLAAPGAQIASVEWLHQEPGFYAVDNLVYGALPEPGIALLVALSLAVAAWRRAGWNPLPPAWDDRGHERAVASRAGRGRRDRRVGVLQAR